MHAKLQNNFRRKWHWIKQYRFSWSSVNEIVKNKVYEQNVFLYFYWEKIYFNNLSYQTSYTFVALICDLLVTQLIT
jgi:hypothetical protein